MKHKFKEDSEFTLDMPFGEYIRKKRRLMGFNQRDFGSFFGVAKDTVSMWELRVTSPPFDKAVEIISRLGGTVVIANKDDVILDEPLGYNPYQE